MKTTIMQQGDQNFNNIIIDDVELREIFKVCRKTLFNYRKKKLLPFIKLNNGKILYLLSDVIKLFGRNNFEQ